MFKRLKEKISEEVKQSPLLQYSPFKEESSKSLSDANGTESGQNLIDLQGSDCPANDLSENLAFSIGGGDDDGGGSLPSEPTSPLSPPVSSFENVDLSDNLATLTSPGESRRRRRLTSADSSASSLFPIYSPAVFNHSVQSDLESASEVDDSVVNLEVISKAQLYQAFQKAKSRYLKYKTRYGEVIRAYKDQLGETDKVKSILTESQDKALRRISEMKEQSQLDQKAKQHLEENFRETLDEKEELVRVLQTQSAVNTTEVTDKSISNDCQDGNDVVAECELSKKLHLQEDTISKLKNLLKSCKETITKQRESLAQAEEEANVRMATFAEELRRAAEKADLLERKEEDRAVQLAESKRLMHEDLEVREENERRLKEQLQVAIAGQTNLQTELQDKSNLISRLEAANLDDLQVNLGKVESEFEAVRVEAAIRAEEVRELNSRLDGESQRCIDLEKSLASKDEEIVVRTSELEASSAKISFLEREMNDLNMAADNLRTKLDSTEEESMRREVEYAANVERLESKLKCGKADEELDKKHEELQALFATVSSEKAQLEVRLMNIDVDSRSSQVLTMTKEAVHNLKQQLCEMHEIVNDERKEMLIKSESLAQTFQTLFEVNRDIEERFGVISSACDSATSDLEGARHEITQLKLKLEIAENAVEETNRNSENDVLNKTLEIGLLTEKLMSKAAELDDLTRQTERWRILCGHADEEIGLLRAANDDLVRRIDSLKGHKEISDEECQSLRSQNEILEAQVVSLNTQVTSGQHDVEALERRTEEWEAELDSLNNRNGTLDREIGVSKDKISSLELEVEASMRRNDELAESHRTELEELRQKHKDKLNELNMKFKAKLKNVANKQSAKVSATQTKHLEEKTEVEARLMEAVRRSSELETQLTEKTEAMDTLKLKVFEVESSLDSLKSVENELKSCTASSEDLMKVLNQENGVLLLEQNRLMAREKELEEIIANFKERHILEVVAINEESRVALNSLKKNFEEELVELKEQMNVDKSGLLCTLEIKDDCIRRLQEDVTSAGSTRELENSNLEGRISQLELRLQDEEDRHRAELEELRTDHKLKCNEFTLEKESLLASIATKNAQIDESLVTAQENEMHSLKIHRELQDELAECRHRIKSEEADFQQRSRSQSDEHLDEVRRLTRHFEDVLAEREKEAARELANAVEQGLNEDNRMRRNHAKQIREIGAEIADKEAVLEASLIESRARINTVESELESLRAEHQQQLRAIETKWKSLLEKESRKLEASHREELDGLYQEWQTEKTVPLNSDVLNSEELQKEASLATLVLESGDHSSELLRRQIMTMQTQMEVLRDRHRNEVSQLKDAMKTNDCPIPRFMDGGIRDQRLESLEIEYLKNILFEYMMGRERLTMAKVISAVVRFSEEQTNKVLEREESRGVGGQIAQLLK